jgi:Zn-dependent M16 (insulinase) family peptidase
MGSELDDRPYDYDRRLLDAIQKVTPKDVKRVAGKYLDPSKLTIAIFGSLTDEDRKKLKERFGITVLPREAVFKGGYEDAPAPGAAGAG